MCKKDGYYTGGNYWSYNPETGEYDMRFETEAAYEEWYDEHYGEADE